MAFLVSLFVEDKNFIISEGNRPLWQRVIAAVLYTAILLLLYMFFIGLEFTLETKKLKGSFSLIEIAIFLLMPSLSFSVVKDLLFDINNKQYKIQYCVGPIKVGNWRPLPNVEYVSVFKQLLQDGEYVYEVNLWYHRNRHFELYKISDVATAFEMGKHIAQGLDIKLLDATVPNKNKWIEL